MVHVKKNGKLFLFLGSNVFCKLANLYFALVRLIKLVTVSRVAWLFSSVPQFWSKPGTIVWSKIPTGLKYITFAPRLPVVQKM